MWPKDRQQKIVRNIKVSEYPFKQNTNVLKT